MHYNRILRNYVAIRMSFLGVVIRIYKNNALDLLSSFSRSKSLVITKAAPLILHDKGGKKNSSFCLFNNYLLHFALKPGHV